MGWNIFSWFKVPSKRKESDVEEFMRQINAEVSDNVRSILSALTIDEEKKLKELYYQVYKYKSNNKDSLINNKFVLDAIAAYGGDYKKIEEIFEFVKNWDNQTYLPKGIRLILNNQIANEAIEELEVLYKRYNVAVKDSLKDKKNYYYVSSLMFKNEITKCFGNPVDTLSLLLKASELDNSNRTIMKEFVENIESMISKRDIDGRILNKIILYKIRDIDNEHVLEDKELEEIFTLGLVNSGNILEESVTTSYVNNIYDVVSILKTSEARYSGVIIIEIPSLYLKDKEVSYEYSDKVYINSNYIRINPDFIKGYVAIKYDKCELYTKQEVINDELDMPDLKAKAA